MIPVLDRYIQLKVAIQDWLLGGSSLLEISRLLGVTSTSLQELLAWNGLADVEGKAEWFTDVQDVLNLIFLVYSLDSRFSALKGSLKKR